ncbi:MAG: hypothetical protein IPG44_04605 [Anaerolineales bacterium]|jgi:hypothetical protein|nr:hypothetical protein [Anaerolineales bacterium]MCC6986819.1 hypothetical protein [Anaerolineales bacterium]
MNTLRAKLSFGIILLAVLSLLAYAIMRLAPSGLGIDWRLTYRPAALALLRGQNPYSVEVSPEAPFFAAPWGLLPLLPLALLPIEMGRAFVMVIGLAVFGYAAYRAGAKPYAAVLFLLSPPVIHTILNANIEWIPILGFVLPPWLGLFFVTVKPQTGFAVAIWWLIDAWRKGGAAQVSRTFAPVVIAFLISFTFYGLWPLGMFNALNYGRGFNASLWPQSIPIGMVLLAASIQKRDVRYAMSASPCLSPYVLFHAWGSAVFSFINDPVQMTAVFIGLWILVGLRFPIGS